MIEIICEECKKKFSIQNWKSKGRKYCSKKCFYKNFGKLNKGIIRSKENKDKIRKGMILAFKEGKKSKIHSKSFKKGQKPWNYIDGRSKNCSPARYGDDWSKIRLLVYIRDNFTCQACGLKMSKKTGPHHIHHKIPFLQTFDNSLKNLITLCPSCHRKEDARLIKQIKMEV